MANFRFGGDLHRRSPATAATGSVDRRRQRRGGPDLRGHRRARPREPARRGSRRRSGSTRRPAPHQIAPLAAGAPTWRRGDDLEAFIARRQADPVPRRRPPALQRPPDGQLPDGHRSRRPRSPDPCGELHDTQGVWIGDGSAFPTSSGTNPMVSIMALAHRTGEAIADDAGAAAKTAQTEAAQPA